MECKLLKNKTVTFGGVILIEPKWNVNDKKANLVNIIYENFNRTKVECKYYIVI